MKILLLASLVVESDSLVMGTNKGRAVSVSDGCGSRKSFGIFAEVSCSDSWWCWSLHCFRCNSMERERETSLVAFGLVWFMLALLMLNTKLYFAGQQLLLFNIMLPALHCTHMPKERENSDMKALQSLFMASGVALGTWEKDTQTRQLDR